MSFHPEVLTPTQRRVLAAVGPAADRRGFVMGGGTAVALHLGHRRSEDFDWFTGDAMGDAARLAADLHDEMTDVAEDEAVEETGASGALDLKVQQLDRGTLHAAVAGVRVSFLEFRYPLLADPLPWPEGSCRLLALDDLAAMKLSAIAQRGARKDFVDLYALLTRHRPLPDLLDLYRRKFAIDDPAHLLYALAYFDDAEREPMPEMVWEVGWVEMRDEIAGAVSALR